MMSLFIFLVLLLLLLLLLEVEAARTILPLFNAVFITIISLQKYLCFESDVCVRERKNKKQKKMFSWRVGGVHFFLLRNLSIQAHDARTRVDDDDDDDDIRARAQTHTLIIDARV